MSTRSLKKLALLLTFWIALHTSSLRAQILYPAGTSPVFVEISNSGQFVDAGSSTASDTLLKTGAGTRMFWFPYKSAFRAGTVAGTQWDSSNLGSYSTAFGYNTTASGAYSTASGYNTTASGWATVAFGISTTASLNGASAFGMHTTASGRYSTASGYQSVASNRSSMAFGEWDSASGGKSTASGSYNTAIGTASMVTGSDNTAYGNYSAAFGLATMAIGTSSTSFGYYTTASAYEDFVIGRYNTGSAISGTSWNAADPLFEVGNGTSSTSKDALLLDKSGNMTVQTSVTTPTVIITTPSSDIPMFGS